MKRTAKRYKIYIKIPYTPFFDEAKSQWTTISNEEPTDAELAGIAYKLIVGGIDKSFDKIKEHLRVFEESDIQAEFSNLEFERENLNRPNLVVYRIDLTLAADTYKPEPGEDIMNITLNQASLNREFENLCFDLEKTWGDANIEFTK